MLRLQNDDKYREKNRNKTKVTYHTNALYRTAKKLKAKQRY